MKCYMIIGVFSISTTLSPAHAQKAIDFGLTYNYNMSSQTNYNPCVPDDGTFQWNTLSSYGIGIVAGKTLGDRINLTNRLLYQQKGYVEEAQTAYLFDDLQSPFSFHTLRNRFDYITLESNISYGLLRFKNIRISPLLGLNVNYLIRENIDSEKIDPINSCYPMTEFKGNWKKHSVGYNVGISCSLQEKINLGFEFQRSITPLLATDNVIVKDWTWAVRMDILLSNIFNNQKI